MKLSPRASRVRTVHEYSIVPLSAINLVEYQSSTPIKRRVPLSTRRSTRRYSVTSIRRRFILRFYVRWLCQVRPTGEKITPIDREIKGVRLRVRALHRAQSNAKVKAARVILKNTKFGPGREVELLKLCRRDH